MNSLIKYLLLPELKLILGRYWVNLWVLILIIFMAILSIGVGRSSMLYLQEKMKSPFIKYVDVYVNRNNKVDANNFDRDSLKNYYGYTDIREIKKITLGFLSRDGKYDRDGSIEVVKEKSDFYTRVLSKSPILVSDKSIFSDSNLCLIVTKDFLRKLGYIDDDIAYINFLNYSMGDTIPIKVAAVVSQLPRYTDVIISEALYNYYFTNSLDIRSEAHQNYLRLFLKGIDEVPQKLQDIGFEKVSNDQLLSDGLVVESYEVNNKDISKITGLLKELSIVFVRVYDYKRIKISSIDNVYVPPVSYLSFSFENQDSIMPFKKLLYEKYNLRLDMNTLKSQQNFYFFNNLANMLSIGLILFSIIAILFFTINLILNHIDKNKKNLGTLKAFGLSNKLIITIYSLISTILVTIAFFISYILSFILGGLFLKQLVKISNISIDNTIMYESFGVGWLLLFFIGIPIISIAYWIMIKLKDTTPGDLIYNRHSK